MRKSLSILFIAFLAVQGLYAQQDYHFSQFFASPITYNPANAGAFEADLRAALNFRSQYGSLSSQSFRTYSFAADAPIKLSKQAYDRNFLGVGLYVVNDNTGITNFNNLNVAANLAYAVDIGGSEANPRYISGGLHIGLIQRSQNLDNASWSNQWTGTGFNPALSSGESLNGNISESNFDLGAGVAMYNSIDENNKLLIGVSVLHANTPNIGLLGNEDNLRAKYTGHVSLASTPIGSQVTYLPNLYVMLQGPNRIIDIGSEIEFGLWDRTKFTDFRNNLSLNIGAYYRYKDAIYLIGRVNYYDFSLGMSYDFTASQLSENNNGQGGLEIVLGYRARFTGPGTNRQKLIRSKGL